MVDNKYSKKFPKTFNEATFIDESGYSIYKRTENRRTVRKQGADIDGRYVVPYNPTLLKRYQAHINVEWCNQFGSIKYLFKNINKGLDRVTTTVEDEEKDEISDYYDCRYLSSCKVAWRIFSIDFQLDKVSANTSKFLAWMDRKSIGWIHHVPPSWGKIFYLYRLLSHVRGAIEWEDFRKFEGVVYPICKDACYARGLLEDDQEYIEGIIEASQWGMGDYLQNYFVILILSNTMSRPEIGWEKTWHLLAEDVLAIERKKQNHLVMPSIIQHQALYESLTDEQRGIYGTIVRSVDNNKGEMFSVYGYGGTRKTFLYKTLTDAIRSKGGIVLNVASRIVSLLLDGELIREAKLIIWDEAPMINRLAYEAFDRTLRYIATGKIGGKNDGNANVEFSEEMLIPDSIDHVESLINETYENWEQNL
ncbi:ribonuclease H-like domain, reverse transcriptase, RNA-dependent DNA polymerase [Tanacetum coccineum]